VLFHLPSSSFYFPSLHHHQSGCVKKNCASCAAKLPTLAASEPEAPEAVWVWAAWVAPVPSIFATMTTMMMALVGVALQVVGVVVVSPVNVAVLLHMRGMMIDLFTEVFISLQKFVKGLLMLMRMIFSLIFISPTRFRFDTWLNFVLSH
jgi:hypothetical protein